MIIHWRRIVFFCYLFWSRLTFAIGAFLVDERNIFQGSESRSKATLPVICFADLGGYEGGDKSQGKPFPRDRELSHNNLREEVGGIKSDYRKEWGVTFDEPALKFPQTVDQVVNQAFDAIAGTLTNKQKLDPNIASNARSQSIFTHRPVRSNQDAGRIGIEIDGSEVLFSSTERYLSSGIAMRRVALKLASKISAMDSWEDYIRLNDNSKNCRDVVVCFNTIKQALTASQEFSKLKRYGEIPTACNSIRIQSLADGIPEDMKIGQGLRRRYGGLSDGYVNVNRGILIIVQPTDYNMEYSPPGPAVGAVNYFQKIVAQASVEEIPTIVLSPRFLSNESPFGGYDQSGYQKSATYGGREPPNGPTPWVMRDFTPPSYCWVGKALTLGEPRDVDSDQEVCHISRIALTQSVMQEGHAWNIYAAEECVCSSMKAPTRYVYLASTNSAAGRPTRDIIRRILDEF